MGLGEALSCLEETDLVSFEADRREAPAEIGPGIDIDAPEITVGIICWRMSMNHDDIISVTCIEKLVPDPKQVVFLLLIKGTPRPRSGMSKPIAAKTDGEFQAPHEMQVGVRKFLNELVVSRAPFIIHCQASWRPNAI